MSQAENTPVPDAEILYRRVTSQMVNPVDGRPNSMAFRTNHPDGVSTSASSLVTPEQCLEDYPGMGLVAITAAQARACGAVVVRDEADPTHVLLQGVSRKAAKLLSERASIVRQPHSADEGPSPRVE
jgi:hypothetical protein